MGKNHEQVYFKQIFVYMTVMAEAYGQKEKTCNFASDDIYN